MARTDRRNHEGGQGFTNGAGDAVGTLRRSSGKTKRLGFLRSSASSTRVLKAASNAFVTEEQALGDVGPNRFYEPSRQLLRAPRSGRPGLLYTTRGRISCYPSPPGFFPPPLGTELRRNLSHKPRSIEAQIISGPRRTPRRRCHSEIPRYSRWPTYLVLRWN